MDDTAVNGNDFIGIPENWDDDQTGFDILCAATIRQAEDPNADMAWDTGEQGGSPSSFLGTREQYIRDITTWAITSNTDETLPMYWVKGPPGVGKTVVAKTCVENVIEIRQPSPIFFFNPNHIDEHKQFIPALAVQLSAIFPRYRWLVDELVYVNKSLVHLDLTSQFQLLIIDPLWTLMERGDGIGSLTIFIDSIDMCKSKEAQIEILEIIAASVQDPSSPFRWAIFSRPEPHIEAIFNRKDVSSLCYRVLLPIAGEIEDEIELYLRTGFENLLRNRGPQATRLQWPSYDSIQKLVKASAGQFAYPAAALRLVDEHPFHRQEHALRTVLDTISSCDKSRLPLPPTAYLDALYMLILRRIPHALLPSTRLLLADLAFTKYSDDGWLVATHCNSLGVFMLEFRMIYDHLQSVLEHWKVPEPRKVVARSFNTTRSFYDQGHRPGRSPEFMETVIETGGILIFRDRSFFDFLCDPNRSSIFCVSTLVMHEQIFHLYFTLHQEMAQKFNQSLGFIPAHDVSSSYPPLPCPAGNELMDSILNWDVFDHTTRRLLYRAPTFTGLLEKIPEPLARKLRDLDYRKYMEADQACHGEGLMDTDSLILGCPGCARRLNYCTWFGRVDTEYFGIDKGFDPDVFLKMVNTLETLNIIHPYHPLLPSRLAFLSRFFTSEKRSGKIYGQYQMGEGKKSIFWYWEMDKEQRYFHEFRTSDFGYAMRIYQKDKFRIWEDSWVPP